MRLALHEDLLEMKKGTPVLVNLTDSVSDIGLFVEYLPSKRKVVVNDCFSLGRDKRYHANVHEYDKCMIIDADEAFFKTLAILLNK